MSAKNTLFLFTNEYPCSKVLEHYIGHEISFLSAAFEKVIIIPSTTGTVQKKIPSNVVVVDLFDKKWFSSSVGQMLACFPLFIKVYIQELFQKKGINFSRGKLISEFKTFYNAYISGIAIQKYASLNSINIKQCAFYSYWFYHAPLISGILKQRGKIDSFYSRAHQADLYTEQFKGNDSFYNFKINQITKLALADSRSLNYISGKFSQYKHKFFVSHVSVSDLGLNPLPEKDFVVVSCSSYSERKRIDLLAELIANYPKQVKWIHFGYVPPNVLEVYSDKFGSSENFKSAKFLGDVSNEELMSFYKTNPVSVIVNVSLSEGLPVSLVEAAGFGIPCIVTDVNGTPDIATPQNGFLIPVNFKPEEFYNCLDKIKENNAALRQGARDLMFKSFYAEKNYNAIISLLKQ